jgi:hypothetical protein
MGKDTTHEIFSYDGCDDDSKGGISAWQETYRPSLESGRSITFQRLEAIRRNEKINKKLKIDNLVEQENREELD